MIIKLILILYLWIDLNFGQTCDFTVQGLLFEGSKFSSTTLLTKNGNYQYMYTPCRNEAPCTSSDDSYMVTQGQEDECVAYLAQWSDSITPTFSNDNGGTFTFTYTNGHCTGNTAQSATFKAQYICDSDSNELYSTIELVTTSNCDYTMKINTQYGCGYAVASDTGLDELSVGTIILISLISLIFLYCLIGYILNLRKNKCENWNDFKNNLPHLSFWCIIPKYTWAGCIVTKECILNSYHKHIKKDEAYVKQKDVDD